MTTLSERLAASSERLAALWRELDRLSGQPAPDSQVSPVGQDRSASRLDPRILVEASGTGTRGSSAWADAVLIARLRDERRAKTLDSSVRTLSRELGWSHGRAGELLQIHDAFDSRALRLVGKGTEGRGGELLSSLSYRKLRSILAIPASMPMTRVQAARRMLDAPRTSARPLRIRTNEGANPRA